MSKLCEIKHPEGQTALEFMSRFKYAIGKLSYLIDLNHQWDWFIKALFPFNRTLLTQQNIDTLQDYLEKETRIEAMVGCPNNF